MQFIVACDEKWAIGKDNALLDHLKEDMAFFKKTTVGHVVIMGRKTLESFPGGRPLKDRINIVLSSQADYAPEGVVIVHSLDDLAKYLHKLQRDDVFVIGGESIYRMLLPYCREGLLTHLQHAYDGADAFFPNLDESGTWRCVSVLQQGEEHGIAYRICCYENTAVKSLEEYSNG